MAQQALSLVRLTAEVDRLFPNRDLWSEGWLGDDSHATRFSDHNPDGNGWVHAHDYDATKTHTMGPGPVGDYLIAALLRLARTGKSPINYLIYRGVIYSRSVGFRGRRYTGSNSHHSHVHVSIIRTTAARNWGGTWLSDNRPKLDLSKARASATREPGHPSITLNPTNTRNVSIALHKVGLLRKIFISGHWTSRKRRRYADWQVKCGARRGSAQANGIPGPASLKALAAKTNMRYVD